MIKVVELTIIAFGTSAPELVVSIRAGFDGLGNIAVGNIIGSNIFNIAVILGCSAIVHPLKVNVLRIDTMIMIALSIIFLILLHDTTIASGEAVCLTLGIIIHTLGKCCITEVDKQYLGTNNLLQYLKTSHATADILFSSHPMKILGMTIHIYIDADACPVKQEVYRVARRYHVPVTLVANTFMRIPSEPGLTLEIVKDHPDEADNRIVELVQKNDVVITADIPLADRCIKAHARVLTPTGKEFNEDNIGGALAMRNFMSDLRNNGTITGGPAPFDQRNRSRFLQQLDRILVAVTRDTSSSH